MKKFLFWIPLVSFMLSSLNVQAENNFPEHFDSLGPTVKSFTNIEKKTINYIDDGNINGTPVILLGGLGTSVRAIRLLDFLRTMREQLNIRLISVERNGFGQTPFNPNHNMNTYVQDVINVLDYLEISEFSLFGISGGGPYAAKIASLYPDRITSIHMAATAPILGTKERCENGQINNIYKDILRFPMQFFAFPDTSELHQLDGFQDSAFEEAARAHYLHGQMANSQALDHELTLYCNEGVIDTSNINIPVYVYVGLADPLLIGEDINDWDTVYPKAKIIKRTYPKERHDVQYRHLDQILMDIKNKDTSVLICKDGINTMINDYDVDRILSANATLGLCLWNH